MRQDERSSPPSVNATVPLRFGPAPSTATIRPMPYWGCSTETPGRNASEVDRPRGSAGEPAGRAAELGGRRQAELAEAVGRGLASAPAGPRATASCRPVGSGGSIPERSRMLDRLLGQLVEEARRDRGLLLAAELADPAAAQVELALGPGDADEQQPPLLLQLAVVLVGPRVGQEPLLQRRR